MMQPGWYYAEGDPAGTQRYWDGEIWQGEPVAAPVQAAAPGQPPMGMGGGYQSYPESSQATTALVLGILSLVICGLLAPFAWHIGNQEIAGIDAGRRDPSNRGSAQAGRIIGMIVCALMVIGILFFIVVIGLGAAS